MTLKEFLSNEVKIGEICCNKRSWISGKKYGLK